MHVEWAGAGHLGSCVFLGLPGASQRQALHEVAGVCLGTEIDSKLAGIPISKWAERAEDKSKWRTMTRKLGEPGGKKRRKLTKKATTKQGHL